MPIRPDFEEVEPPLNRLLLYGRAADEFNRETWPHLKNREDFERIYTLSDEERSAYEDLYGDGRDCAVWMANVLCGFNDVENFPTLRTYVAAFTGAWVYQTEVLRSRLAHIAELRQKHGTQPWSVREMAKVYQKQIDMLEATAIVLEQLKKTGLYRREGGEPELPSEGGAPGHGGFILKVLAGLAFAGLAIVAIHYLGFWGALLWLAVAVLALPLFIAFATGAGKLTGGHLVELYAAGVKQLPAVIKELVKRKPKA